MSGAYTRLQGITRQLSAMASGSLQRALADALATEALSLVDRGFREQHDPYGIPWKPRVRARGSPILVRTGRLRGGFRARVTARGVTITNRAPYFWAHQNGATIRAGARVNAHTRTGRFLSREGARARTRGPVRVSFTSAHEIRLPARPMVPNGVLGGLWQRAFDARADRVMRTLFIRDAA